MKEINFNLLSQKSELFYLKEIPMKLIHSSIHIWKNKHPLKSILGLENEIIVVFESKINYLMRKFSTVNRSI
jgi:hypothetical protein